MCRVCFRQLEAGHFTFDFTTARWQSLRRPQTDCHVMWWTICTKAATHTPRKLPVSIFSSALSTAQHIHTSRCILIIVPGCSCLIRVICEYALHNAGAPHANREQQRATGEPSTIVDRPHTGIDTILR